MSIVAERMMRPRSLSFFVVLVCSFASTEGAVEVSASPQDFLRRLVSAAIERTNHAVRYDPAYVRIRYPGVTFQPTPVSVLTK
jgi:uncharacterized protein YijF (DUF1287 family)